jgi:hypothetical protein
MTERFKVLSVTFGLIFIGWGLVHSEQSRQEPPQTHYQVVVQTVEVEVPSGQTPVIDSMIDWEKQDKENECLWNFMQEFELEITFDMVWAAGKVTDALGGACLVMGDNDE